MRLVFTPRAWGEYTGWQARDASMIRRINRVLDDCLRHPHEGLGQPERLRGDLSGHWSRRITQEHRMVYRVDSDDLVIVQLRYHYGP
jgi:toxin YoeB